MENEKPVSFREFARLTGTSDGAVRKAIARESIKEGLVDDGGKVKILPSVASKEWGKPIISADPVPKDATAQGALAKDELIALATSWAEKPDISNVPTKGKDLAGEPVAEEVAPGLADDELSDEDIEVIAEIKDNTSKAEAERQIAVFKARKAKAEFLKVSGELVEKSVVYQQLFDFATVIKQAIMNVPDRCIDNVLAADNRNEAQITMSNELADALTSLSNMSRVMDKISNV
jgi:hypothetical protein